MIPPVPFKQPEEIREVVDRLLAEHHPSREIPIPIDLIAERLGLDLVPIPGFRGRAGVEGALSTDRTTIYFDVHRAEAYPSRYRFTVAHELGHYLLHQAQMDAVALEGVEHWKQAVNAIDPQSYSRLEWQSNQFAGQLLVPDEALNREYLSAAAKARAGGIDLAGLDDYSMETVASSIGERFLVSGNVIQIRLQATGIYQARR